MAGNKGNHTASVTRTGRRVAQVASVVKVVKEELHVCQSAMNFLKGKL